MSFDNSPASQDKPTEPGPNRLGDVPGPPPLPPVPGDSRYAPLPQLGGYATMQQPWAGDNHSFPIQISPGRVTNKNQLSEFRTGQIIVGANGITITGKATQPNSTRTLVYVLCIVILRIGIVIAYLLMEYAFRRDRTDNILWSDVEGIAYDPVKGRICIAYHQPDKPKVSFALGSKIDSNSLEQFLHSVNQYAPGKVQETKILPPTPTWVWIFLGVVFAALIAFTIYGSIHH